ncbi:MAG TPA: response regulator transcription factor [Planctomycetota bacterium]
MQRRILLVEDDRELAELARVHLQEAGYGVEAVHDGATGNARARDGAFDLVILDLMLPGLDGLEICRRIRARASYTPTLILTARSAEVDRVLGLEVGADDYLTKPVSLRELVARVKAIFRRVDALANGNGGGAAGSESVVLDFGALQIDPPRHQVVLRGRKVELTAREFDLLLHFATHPGRVFSRRELLDGVWGYAYEGYEHTVNSHINRLRSKIEADPGDPEWIHTVWGVGYRFREDATE